MSRTNFKELRELFCRLYPDPQRARLIAMDCGIDASSVNFYQAVELVWQSLLELADNKFLVSSIIERAREDYPTNSHLSDYSSEEGAEGDVAILVDQCRRLLEAAGYREKDHRITEEGIGIVIAERRVSAWDDELCIAVVPGRIDPLRFERASGVARRTLPHAKRVKFVTNVGFTTNAASLADARGDHLMSVSQLRRVLIPTSAYEDMVLGSVGVEYTKPSAEDENAAAPLWHELDLLERAYQEPLLSVTDGAVVREVRALAWFDEWLRQPQENRRWVSLIGNYGSGKTALTKMLLRQWMQRYRNGGRVLPVRIELRDFARKFDEQGLLFHWWTASQFEDVPFKAFSHLMDQRRVVFLLDGYDEMAQNLGVLDRRACLTTLTRLIAKGCPGLLTSRPNYFTDAEELRVVEILYDSPRALHRLDRDDLPKEQEVDALLKRYVMERADAQLADLSREQVDRLIHHRLGQNPGAFQRMSDLIRRIYDMESSEHSLGTKPVVIMHLLEVAENASDDAGFADGEELNDWTVYTLIFDELAERDRRRTSGIVKRGERRTFLQHLAITLTAAKCPDADSALMRKIIAALFEKQLRRHGGSDYDAEMSRFFMDLRSSASLTSKNERWTFSHASLREFLVAETFVECSTSGGSLEAFRPIVPTQGVQRFLSTYLRMKPDLLMLMRTMELASQEIAMTMLLPSVLDAYGGEAVVRIEEMFGSKTLGGMVVSGVTLRKLDFAGWEFRETVIFDRVNFENCTFDACRFSNVTFSSCSFTGCRFEQCNFRQCEWDIVALKNVRFVATSFTNEKLEGVFYRGASISGADARALLVFLGATVTPPSGVHLNVYQFSQRWGDFQKVISQLTAELGWRQRLGLVTKGKVSDSVWAGKLLDALVSKGFCQQKRGGDAVRVAPEHLAEMTKMLTGVMPNFVERLFEDCP
jgi:uncharacterized protein YjbI with pentapeptide repeats